MLAKSLKDVTLLLLFIALLLFNPVVICHSFEDEEDTDQALQAIMAEWELQQEDIYFHPVFPKRNLLTDLERADQLSEWTPIKDELSINSTQYYEFVVNTTQTGLGEYYEILIFLSGNICSLPDNLDDIHAVDNQLQVYYSFNQSDLYNLTDDSSKVTFEYGYMQALASNPTADPYSNLYIAVKTPYTSKNISGVWSYELGISQNDLVFQWDDRSWAQLVDSDDDSALFVTGNLSTQYNVSQDDVYKLHIYQTEFKDYFEGLNRSWCAISNGESLIKPDSVEMQLTNRYGNMKQQFFVQGLNSSTSYIAYLTQDFSGNGYGGSVYQQFSFETLDANSCELIYDLEFCKDVAYSVPVSSSFLDLQNETYYNDKHLLSAFYDNYTESLYQNFSKAIQVIACDDELDSRYSPIRTCSDCINSYKNWLCSVNIPRCSTRNFTGYKYRDVNENRNDFINDIIIPPQPYFEILPCVNTCQAIMRDCPADFGFACPTGNTSISMSYYWDSPRDDGYPTCNYFGAKSLLNSSSDSSPLVLKNLASLNQLDYRLLLLSILLCYICIL